MNLNLLIFILFVPFLALILLFLNILLSPHKSNEDKLSTFECGSPIVFGQARESFKIHYWLVCMLFLVFDIELVLLLPVAVSLYAIDTYGFYIAILFFIILIIGFIFEIGVGAISIKPSNVQKETYNNNSSFYLINPFFVYKLKVFFINRSNYYKVILYTLITEWKYHQTGILPYYFEDYFRNEKFQDFFILGFLSTCVLLSTIFFGVTKYPLFILYYCNVMAYLFCIFLIIVVFSLVIEIITDMYHLIWNNTYVFAQWKITKIIIVTYYTFIYSFAYFSTLFIIFYILYFIIIRWIFYLFIYV